MNQPLDIGMRSRCVYVHAVFAATGCDASVPGMNQVWCSSYAPDLGGFYTHGAVLAPDVSADPHAVTQVNETCSYRKVRTAREVTEATMHGIMQNVMAGFAVVTGFGVRHGMLAHIVRDAYAHGITPFGSIEMPVQEQFARLGVELFDVADVYTQRDPETSKRIHAMWHSPSVPGTAECYYPVWRWSDGIAPTIRGVEPRHQHNLMLQCGATPAPLGALCALARTDAILAAYTRTPPLSAGFA